MFRAKNLTSDQPNQIQRWEHHVSLGVKPKIAVWSTNSDPTIQTAWEKMFWIEGEKQGALVSVEEYLDMRDSMMYFWNGDQQVDAQSCSKLLSQMEFDSGRVDLRSLLTPSIVTEGVAMVNEVRETATAVSSMISKVEKHAETIKEVVTGLVDLRTLQLDLEIFFDNPEVNIIDKFGRFIFYVNHFCLRVGKYFEFDFFKSSTEPVAQSLVDSLTGFVRYCFNFVGLSETHFRIFQQFNTLDTFYSRISQRFIHIFDLFRYVFEFISRVFNTPQILEWYDKVTNGGVKTIMLEAHELLHMPIDDFLEIENKEKLNKTCKKAEELVLLAGMGSWKNAHFLKTQLKSLTDLQVQVTKMEDDAFGRITPFCICIGGESQIGKSQVLLDIANSLIPSDVPVSKAVYARGQTEHYDGYKDQYCIIVDDWASRVDTDYSELLQWVTCQTTILPMASVDSSSIGIKGTTCRAKLVILATNTLYPPMSTVMNNGEAVLKRRRAVVEAKVIPGKEKKDDFSHLKFMLKHPEFDRNLLSDYISYTQLIEILKDRNKIHLEIENNLFEVRKARALLRRENVGRAQVDYEDMLHATSRHAGTDFWRGMGSLTDFFWSSSPTTTYVAKAVSLGLNAVSAAASLSMTWQLVEKLRTGQPLDVPLFLQKSGLAVALYAIARYVESSKAVVEFDLYKILDRTVLEKGDVRWIVSMFEKRLQLRKDLAKARKGCKGYDTVKLERTLRSLDMLSHWETLDYLDSEDKHNFSFDSIQRMDNLDARHESDMRNNDGVRKKRKAVAVKEMQDLILPKPFENQVFRPKAQGLRYIDFYVDFLKETGKEIFLEKDIFTKWAMRWAEACNVHDNVYSIIDYINNDGVAEASADVNGDALAQILVHNMTRFKKLRKGVAVGTLNALNVKGTLFVLPYHFFLTESGMEDDCFDIEITNGFIYDNNTYGTSSKLLIPFSKDNLHVSNTVLSKKDDWCLYDVGRSWAPGKNIFNHFIKEQDLEFLTDFNAQLILKAPMRIIHHTKVKPNEYTTYSLSKEVSGRFSLIRSWSYTANTQAGDCGAPLMVRDSRMSRKIVGMHVSAITDTDRAFGSVLTQEKISSLFPGIAQWCEMPRLDLIYRPRHIMFNNFEYVGSVEKSKQVVPPTKSSIRESLISDLFEKKKYPAVLDMEDERYLGEEDILEKQQDKYTGLRKDIEKGLMDEIVNDIVVEHSIDLNYPRRVLTEHETLNGFDTLPRVDPHSSAGYPFNTGWFKKEHELVDLNGKESYLELKDDGWHYRSSLMRDIVDLRERKAKIKRRVKSFWTASLKDETLSMTKITTGNTRLFMNPPMDFTLLLRKYTGAFSSFVFKHNIKLGCAAGFNPESGIWTELAFMLTKINARVMALDYTWFDGSLGAQLIFAALDIINKWYKGTEEEDSVRFTLFHEIVFTYIIVRREVYMKNKGNPSGNAVTMVMNNLISKILVRYYWMVLTPINYRDLSIFRMTVYLAVCGDDNIAAFPPELDEVIKGEDIIDVAATLGLTATSERKDKSSVFKPLSETTFLKRGFREDGVHVKPTLDLKSIENMMIWISNSSFMSALECTQVNVECAMRYLYFWGPIVFNTYRDLLMKASTERELNLPLYSYEYYDRIFNSTGQLENNFAQMAFNWIVTNSAVHCKNGHRLDETLNQSQYASVKMAILETKMENTNESAVLGNNDEEKKTTLEVAPIEPIHNTSKFMEGDLDGSVRDEHKQGFIFSEQTQAVSVMHKKASYAGTIEEKDWNMTNFFLVPVRVASGTWSQTATPGQLLRGFFPTGIHESFSRWSNIINQYSYYRYRLRLRVELNGTPFHSGSLVLAWRPITEGITSRKTLKAIQHVTLNASYNTVGELETYWFPPCEWLASAEKNHLGNIGLYVFNQLKAGTGASTTLGYTIYGQLLDVQLSLPRPLSNSAQGLINVQNITVTGNAPINTVGDSYDLKVSGLDLASNVKDPEKMIRWGISNPFMVHGNPAVDRLSSYPSSLTLATENSFNVTWDEMDIDWIKRVPGYKTTVSFKTTDTFGQILASGPCAPLDILSGPSGLRTSTPLEWLAAQFVNWRGDLEMCVEVISTQYHTGKLFFGINYTSDPVADFSTTGVDPSTFYGKVIEVNNKETCFVVNIPYQHWAPWLDVSPNPGTFNGINTIPSTNLLVPFTVATGPIMNRHTLGEWFLAVLNPLVVPTGVSSDIEINIYMRGGDNFEVHRPGFSGLRGGGVAQVDTLGNQKERVNTATVSQFVERPRSMRDLMKRAILADSAVLFPIPGSGTSAEANRQGYMRVLNLDDILRSQAPFATMLASYNAYVGDLRVKIVVDFRNQSANASSTVFVGFVNRPGCVAGNNLGFPSMIADQLFPIRGSYAISGQAEQINPDALMAALTPAYVYGLVPATNGWETSHVITENCNVLELEVPYYSFMKYNTVHENGNIGISAYGFMYYFQPATPLAATGESGARIYTYLYAGDSLRCGQWVGPAKLAYIRSNALSTRYSYFGIPGVTTLATSNDDMGDWEPIPRH